MEKSSHYYAVLALSRICGMKKEYALCLAYASQFVDDAKINHFRFKEPKVSDQLFEERDGKQILVNVATCHSYFVVSHKYRKNRDPPSIPLFKSAFFHFFRYQIIRNKFIYIPFKIFGARLSKRSYIETNNLISIIGIISKG